MLKKNNFKLNFHKIFIFSFYSSFLTIVSFCLLEATTYPGIFLNKINIGLSQITFILSLIHIFSFLYLIFFKSILKISKTLFIFSLSIISITLILTLLELFTYPNFVFSKFYINHKALQTLSSFFILFLLCFFIPKINLKKIFEGKSKLIIVILLLLTPILSYFSWSQHLSTNSITKSQINFLSWSKDNSTLIDESKKQAFNNQINWFFKPVDNYSQINIFFNLFTISFSALFTIIFILFFINWLQNRYSPKIGIALLFFYLGGIAYLFLIIFICVTMFSIGELRVFMGRYILTYYLALIIFSFYLFLVNFQNIIKINISSLIYLSLLCLIINVPNIIKIKPADKESFLNRKKQELFYEKIKNNFKKNDKPIFHTIGKEGSVGYRYYFTPYSVISPIWQEWDIFMLENYEFKKSTYVFLSSASDVIEKWSNPKIEKIFKDKKNIIDNGLYKVIYETEDKSSFHLELINNYQP